MRWHAHEIGEVAQVNPKLAAADRPDLNDKVSFVPMASVSEETMSIAVQEERPFSEVSKGYTPFKRGDVLVAKITPCFENGKMALADNLPHELGFGTTEFHVFRPSERITGPYLYNILRVPWLRTAGAMKMRGAAGQRRVPADFIASIEIPVPPIAEQKRIAEILDAADALRAKRREALAQLDTLLQSTFLDMFGDPVTNPMGWEVVELVSLIERGDKINYGVVQPGDDSPDGKPLIRVGDFVTGELVTSNLKLIDPAIEGKYQRSRLNGRELLISCVGSIGTVCTVPSEAEGFNIARAVARVPLVESVDRDFMLHCLRCGAVQRHFLRETRTVSQPTLNIGLIKNAPVIQPPAILRNRFANIVESVEQQKTRQRAHFAELDTLFASLQSRAFRGDL